MKRIVVLIIVAVFSFPTMAQDNKQKKLELKGDLISATLYHDNGEVAQIGFYTKEGKLQGEWNSFDKNGIHTAKAYYDDGNKVGTWIFYNGNTKKEVSYVDSRVSEVKTWEVTGTRVVTNKP